MIRSTREPGLPDHLECGVAIVGSGAAGIALALRLEAKGVSCTVIEAGSDKLDAASQEFYRASSISPDIHTPVHLYRRRAFGGTTAVWGGRCIPFDPIDFEDRSWMPHAKWPIPYDEVAAYFQDAVEVARAGPALFHAAEALPGSAGDLVEGVTDPDVILDRIERFSEPTHFGREYRQRLTDSTLITVLTEAPATQLEVNEAGTAIAAVRVRAADGREVRVAARTVVVAVGGLETPRLLLASRDGKGVGNDRDQVGRFYQVHLEGEIGEIAFSAPPSDVHLDYERSPEGIYCRRYIWLSPEAQRREKLAGLILRPAHATIVDPEHRRSVLSAMYLVKNFIVPEYSRKMTAAELTVKERFKGGNLDFYGAHLRNILLGAPELAGFALNWTRGRTLAKRKIPSVVLRDHRNRYPVDINAEQSPTPDSRITLSDDLDSLGMPRIRIAWQARDDDYQMIERGMRTLATAMNKSGTVSLELDDAALRDQVRRVSLIGGHHIGTARMASDPSTGVVDGNCKVFGVEGLYLAGAAVLPTSGFANPTLMLVSLALRLGDHLAAERT